MNKKGILQMFKIFSIMNFQWQNFIEDMFGMGNFSCPTYQRELNKTKK